MLPEFKKQKNPTGMLALTIAKSCWEKGICHAVISPGSRNAPLIKAFSGLDGIKCTSVPDERSAGYIALGIAQQINKPVALICTSGTAALNFSPALAEAYYLKMPLLALTADRPAEWIDQMDGQTIQQFNLFAPFVQASENLSPITGKNDLWHNIQKINRAFRHLGNGPVHLNVPFAEPLYDDLPNTYIPNLQKNIYQQQLPEPSEEWLKTMASAFLSHQKILIVPGLQAPNEKLGKLLGKLNQFSQVAILNHHLVNMPIDGAFNFQDRLLDTMGENLKENFKPSLLISFGGPVLSKKLKIYLRDFSPMEHWRINEENEFPDTFQSLTHAIHAKPSIFFESLFPLINDTKSSYKAEWTSLANKAKQKHDNFVHSAVWSDFKVFHQIMREIPKESILHLGNSSPVRYADLFPLDASINCFCNRGTSGIDGCLSTAVGASIASKQKTHTIVLGDMSFIYDSNALWNTSIQQNLKIIVINNQGGNIFRLIPGPKKTGLLEKFFEAHVPVSIQDIAKAHGICHTIATNEKELTDKLQKIYREKRPILLEVTTHKETNTNVWDNYYKQLKKSNYEQQ